MELLVVIAIIGLLVALLLPAVQAARESARRTECLSNLRQVGLATLRYIDTEKTIPPGFVAELTGDFSRGNSGLVVNGFFPLILPYCEQSQLQDIYDYSQGFDHITNQPAVRTRVKIFQCPSVPETNRTTELWNEGAFVNKRKDGFLGQATDYYGVNSAVDGASDLITDTPEGDTAGREGQYFVSDKNDRIYGTMLPVLPTPPFVDPLRPAQVTDGLSKTLLLVEIAGRPERYARGVKHESHPFATGSSWAGPMSDLLYQIDIERSLEGTRPAPEVGDCAINCHSYYTSHSFHPGGVHLMLLDGSAQFLNEETEYFVWLALVDPDDGNVFDPPW